MPFIQSFYNLTLFYRVKSCSSRLFNLSGSSDINQSINQPITKDAFNSQLLATSTLDNKQTMNKNQSIESRGIEKEERKITSQTANSNQVHIATGKNVQQK